MKTILILFLLFVLACDSSEAIGENPSYPAQQRTTIAYKTINGVDPNLLSLDIYHNDDVLTKRPVIFYVHGGAWAIGDKFNSLENKLSLFNQLDYIMVSVNYRLSPTTNDLDPNRIKYPIHNLDIADAFKWVVDNINNYGGDPDKIALLGHSAGAHLVSLMGTNERFLTNVGLGLSNVSGVAAIDTEGYEIRPLVLAGNTIYINAFGTNEQENLDASPLQNVRFNASTPNFFIAKRGTSTRVAAADKFIDVLQQNNIIADQIEANQYSHNGINEAIGKPGETIITLPLMEFFARCFE